MIKIRHNHYNIFHRLLFIVAVILFIWAIRILKVNLLQFDPLNDQIGQYDIHNKVLSKYRDKENPPFDDRIIIINSRENDRANIANAILKLKKFKVNVIGLDVILDHVNNDKADTLLRNAMDSVNNNLVVGYDKYFYAKDSFFFKGFNTGFVNVAADEDGITVRKYLPFEGNFNHFTTALLEKHDSFRYKNLKDRANKIEWINYKRPQPPSAENGIDTLNSSSYFLIQIDSLLNQYDSTDFETFKDKIVLIGYCGDSDKNMSMTDRWITPLNNQSGKSFPDMHGVVIHANILSMVLDNDFIYHCPNWMVFLFGALLLWWLHGLYTRWRANGQKYAVVRIRVTQTVLLIGLIILAGALLSYLNIKLPIIIMATWIIISYDIFEIYEQHIKSRLDTLLSIRPTN